MGARFLQYVEIRTKITSLFAFGTALAWLFANDRAINWQLSLLFFGAMFLFDLTTTAINNYIDTKTNGQPLQFRRPVALAVLLTLFCVSAGLGLLLATRTDLVVFLLGGGCFLCGVFYTWGPLPISRLPFGEVVSGVFYGLAIPFLLLYINQPAGTYLALSLSPQTLAVHVELLPMLSVGLLAVAPCCATANIMLANNLCDLERDDTVRRHTLPYYIGRERALRLFALLCYAPYGAAIALTAFGFLPWVYLLLAVTVIPVRRNLRTFRARQDKASTFVCSIRNYLWLMSADLLFLLVCGLV